MSENKNNAIGVFDSGFGGLSVLRHFLKNLPQYDYIYLGDNARVPYGEKSPETVYEYTREAADYLFQAGCRLIILACNTASALALRRLQQEWLPKAWPDRRMLGVIRPTAEYFAAKMKSCVAKNRRLGIIGTKATINSGAYRAELNKLVNDLQIIDISAPLLVPLIEEGWTKKPETKMILKKYLRPLKEKGVTSLLLACTHYPLLMSSIKKIAGHKADVPDPGEITALSLKDYLGRHPELEILPSPSPRRLFFTTDNPEIFAANGSRFLGSAIKDIRHVKINL